MKKILFTHSYFLRFDPKQWKTGQPFAPLGTLYAASLMREQGYAVSLHDVSFAEDAAEVLEPLKTFAPDYFVVYDDGFNYLTKMCLTNMREAAFEMIALAKRCGCTVMVSSSDSTDHFRNYLEAGADFILLGEAETTLLELTHALDKGEKDFKDIPGLAYCREEEIVRTQRRPVLTNLDSLPLPAWDLVELQKYRDTWMRHAGYFSINIGTTRGCPFKCNWCAKPIYGNRYNARSPRNVVQEIKYLHETFGPDHIWFCDDIFGLKPGWIAEFAELMKREGLRIPFKIQSRADLLLQENYVRDLAKAGCHTIWMGAESGSQKILDAMDKGITVQQVRDAVKLVRKHGMKPCLFIQFGYLGETKEDIELTGKMINELLPDEIGVSVSYPLPGTRFYEKVREDLKEKTNWTDSDELALMFSNTYQPKFYKQLHRFVHHDLKKHKGMAMIRKALKAPLSVKGREWKTALSVFWYVPQAMIGQLKLKRYARPRSV